MPNPVYESVLTRASAERLAGLVQSIPHPVALAGGHAVMHAVQQRWRQRFGQDYFGSRDIDVIYFVDPKWTKAELLASAAAQAPKRIEDLGYTPISFRFVQTLDEHGNTLAKEPTFGIEDVSVFHLYIDPMVTETHSDLKELWSFHPIDEPLLADVFRNPTARTLLPQFGANVYLPATPYLVATKLKSLPQRTKDDKAVKDLCDLYALVAYGGATSVEIRSLIHATLSDVADRVRFALGSPHLSKALEHLDLAKADFEAVIGPLSLRG